ncbi:MAG: GNAT family N-acetyltransferase [Phycisphaeraceae bacterium]
MTSPRLIIRPADLSEAQDANNLLHLIDAYARDPIGNDGPLAPETYQRLIPALRSHPATQAHLALLDEKPVGYAITLLSFSTFKAANVLNLHDIAVLPEHRGQGIGNALLDYLDQHARQLGCCKMTLEVRVDNPAQKLYQRVGFGSGEALEHFLTRWCLPD